MSLFGSLFSGVSALNAQSQAMGIISDNISNVSTVGYKATASRFSTLVTSAATATLFTPGGVQARPFAKVEEQGLIQASSSPTDLAISGQGFFVVNANADSSGGPLYTRAGSFHQDALGNLVNTSGFFLQGWPLDSNGRLPGAPGNITNTTSSADLGSLKTVNVSSINGTAASTSTVRVGANLNATQTLLIGPQDTTTTNSITATVDLGNAPFSMTDGDTFTIVNGTTTGTFEYDTLPAGGAIRNGLGAPSKVGTADGFQSFTFTGTPTDDAFLFSFVSSSRSLTAARGDGTSQTITLASGAISSTETATFSTFGLDIVLNSSFTKTAAFLVDADTESVTGGTGAINSSSIKISDTVGNISTITSKTLTFSNFTNPASITITTGSFSGTFAANSTGAKTVNLTDTNANTLQIQFTLGTAFNSQSTAASITLEELENLVTSKSAGTNEFSNLNELSTLVNAVSGLSGSIGGATTDATFTVTGDDPRDTLVITNTVGTAGTDLFGGTSPLTTVDTYDPTVSSKNMASGKVSAHFSRAVRVFDAQGTGHNVQIAFLKVNTNTWGVELFVNPSTDVTSASPLVNGQIATGTLTFNGDGTLGSISAGLASAISVPWATGSSASSVTFDWGTAGAVGIGLANGLSQFDGGFNVAFVNQNGSEVGDLSGVNINEEGFVIASFNNGQTTRLFKLPITTFADVSRLSAKSGNVYEQSDASGEFNLREAGRGGAGLVAPSSVEAANVDIGKEFTDMIITQRAFSASSRVITTVDAMLDELIRIRR